MTGCPALEELYVSDQRLKGNSITFDLDSMAVISNRLRILEAENCNLQDAAPLAYLSSFFTLLFF